MPRLSVLTAHPRFALHGFYSLLSLLIVLFLILGAVSGPGTGYYWLKVSSADGAELALGGLGSCDGNEP